MMRNSTSIRSFLDQMLTEGRSLAQRGEDVAAEKLGVGDDTDARSQMRKTALVSGAAAGVRDRAEIGNVGRAWTVGQGRL